jgi:hypothetical protein
VGMYCVHVCMCLYGSCPCQRTSRDPILILSITRHTHRPLHFTPLHYTTLHHTMSLHSHANNHVQVRGRVEKGKNWHAIARDYNIFLRAVTRDPELAAGGGGGGGSGSGAGVKPRPKPIPTVRHNYLLGSPGDTGFSKDKLIVSPSLVGGGTADAGGGGGVHRGDGCGGSQESHEEEVSFVEVCSPKNTEDHAGLHMYQQHLPLAGSAHNSNSFISAHGAMHIPTCPT